MKHCLTALFLIFFSVIPARAQSGTDHVRVTLIPATAALRPGEKITIAIEQVIEPGWHTYWVNPGDSGATPRIQWTLPPGFQTGEIAWPAPHRIPYAGLVNFGYEGRVVLLQDLTAPQTLPDGPVLLGASVEILVCKDICIPEEKTLTLVLNDPARSSDHQALIEEAGRMLPVKLPGSGVYRDDGQDLVVTLDAAATEALGAYNEDSLAMLPAEWGMTRNTAKLRTETTKAMQLVLRQERDSRDLAEIETLPVLLTYGTKDGQFRAVSLTLHPEAGTAPGPAQTNPAPATKSLSLIQALLLAFLGGIVLNLMPCVFPVLSLKALKLLQIKDKGFHATALQGLVYTAGILVSFAVIGAAILVLKAAGGPVGWGFQLQNPLMTLVLAYLLFIIGLTLSGLFTVSGAFINAGSSLAAKDNLGGTFFTGILAALVATPCTAPFMAAALGYALVQPAPQAMGVFLALGLGLAAPFLGLCLIPGFARMLPRPGPWMVRFKEFLAFPAYASAAWLVWVMSMQAGSTGLLWALSGMVAIAFSFWLRTIHPARPAGRAVIAGMAVLALLFAALPFIDKTLLSPPSDRGREAMVFSPQNLDQLLRGDDPVFVYMTAAWCITCKVNERVALQDSRVLAGFRARQITVLKGDWTNRDPGITEFLQTYGRSGVPLYVFYGPRDKATGLRPAPQILPQLLTPGIVNGFIGAP